MGIVNATPDSFFPSSRADSMPVAVETARQMFEVGAAVVDIGGESTRPFSDPIEPGEELRRVLPIIERAADYGTVSIDTRHDSVAAEAVAAGATIINDISASLDDVAADTGAAWIPCHMQGDPTTMQVDPNYDDVVDEVVAFLVDAADRGRRAGVKKIWIDPGIGFGKTHAHNMALLANIDRFVATGYPVLVGVSRKGFIGALHARSDKVDDEVARVSVDDRLEGSLALATWCYAQGVDMVRVHDVAETVQATQVVGV